MASNQHGDHSKTDKTTDKTGHGGGNFADDPQRASEAGKKGGQQSHQQSGGSGSQQGDGSAGSQQKGSGNFADNPDKASEAGRKGGQHSHNK